MRDGKERIILGILMLGTLMAAIDSSIVILALPAITESLHSNLSTNIWVITIYLLVIAVSTTQLGRLGDIYGRSRIFNLGFVVFTVGSALCGFAISDLFLIGARIVQAVGGSLLQATTGAIVADTFEVGRRGRAYGYIALGWTLGATLGIVLGGMLTTFAGWRYIFFINLPIGAIGIYLGLRYLRDNPRVFAKIDFLGALLLTVSLVSITYGSVNFMSAGLDQATLLLFGVGLVLLISFMFWETKTRSPMIDINAFRNRVLTGSLLASLFVGLGFTSVSFLVIMYLQGIKGLDPFSSSLLFIPGYLTGAILAPRMGKLSDKYGARIIATLGIGAMGLSVLIYLTLNLTSPIYIVAIGSTVAGAGLSMFFPANNNAVMSNAKEGQYGSVSGLLRTTVNVSALLSYVLILGVTTVAVPRQLAYQVFVGTSKIIGGVSQAFLTGIDLALVASLCLLAVGAVLSFARGKEKR